MAEKFEKDELVSHMVTEQDIKYDPLTKHKVGDVIYFLYNPKVKYPPGYVEKYIPVSKHLKATK